MNHDDNGRTYHSNDLSPEERLERVVDLLAMASLRLIEEETPPKSDMEPVTDANSHQLLKADSA